MKNKKILLLALSAMLMGSAVACSPQKPADKKEEKKEENKEEKKEMPKASEEEKTTAIAALEEQKKYELEVPNLNDEEKKTIESKYNTIIESIKKDTVSKEDVLGLTKAAKNYVENVKKARGEK